MGGMFNLEAFDSPEVADTGPSEAYHDGYAAGFAAATEAADRAEDRLRNDPVQAVSHMPFTYREAQPDVLQILAGLSLGSARQIADVVMARYKANRDDMILVHVNPLQERPVAQATADIAARVKIISDATLSPHAAWIGQAGADAYVDLDGCLADITEILSSLFHESQRNSANG